MATYPVVNKVTGEQKEVKMSIHEWDQWKVDNPEWDRDWSDPSTCPGSGEVGEIYDRLLRASLDGMMSSIKFQKSQVQT